ncbi:MAG: hypothetical protein IKI54_03155, partial [Lachnospiraceae bacterium]|nr:hypothetical protein [Lachnospiraceae bacterium]
MKKLTRILAILLCFVMVFAASCSSCNRDNPTPSEAPVTTLAPTTQSPVPESTEAEPAEEKITQEFVDKAAEMVYEFYKPGHDAVVTQDFTLPSKVKYQGEDIDIKWEIAEGADVASVEMGPDGQWVVKLNKDSLGGPFKLRGIVSCGDFESEIEFDYTVVSQLEVLQRAYALEPGQALDGTQVLTGVVTKINTPYDEGYKNVTVTIVVDGHDDMPIQCYRMKGDDADKVKVNDTITVSGTLKNYNGTIEFDAGCILVSIDVIGEEEPDNSPTFSSDREIVEAAYRLAGGDYLSDTKRYTLTGVVTKINTPYDEAYGNVTVTIV